MKRKRKKGRRVKRPKSALGKILLLLVLVGTGIFLLVHFRQEISGVLKPRVKEPSPGVMEPSPTAKPTPPAKKTVIVYFSDEEEEYLIGEKREIPQKGKVEEEAKALIVELMRGPKGKLIPTLPPHTKLLTLHLDPKGTAKVNFDKTIVQGHPGGSSAEMMTVYSVVNSLAFNFPQIKRVQILVEGDVIKTIKGHLDLTEPIPPNRSLTKKTSTSR